MTKMDATEQAYKNGYNQGINDNNKIVIFKQYGKIRFTTLQNYTNIITNEFGIRTLEDAVDFEDAKNTIKSWYNFMTDNNFINEIQE